MPFFPRRVRAFAVTLAALGGLAAPTPAQAGTSGAFVALSAVAPSILQDIRYDTRHNFVGRRIDGYRQPLCILTRQAAEGLRKVQAQVVRRGYTLKVYDCYRPQRAVDHFVRWAKDLADEKMKAEFYPNVAKDRLFADGYIAEKSGHSRGSTMDLTLVRIPPPVQRPYVPGEPLVPCFAPRDQRFPDNTVDMGTGYDCFDPLAHTDNPAITGAARQHRDLLRSTMAAAGFRNLPEEWWHFTLNGEPFPDTYFDFPVSRGSLP
ncbi:M15 family metallopeptidase [Amycolatopsis sp.]|uniref:M15 family metallopeptidase n=1 Tax=Amycolatopsis sp. TaxID=37632 RepID=UPI002D80A441|nr:M15 family metallopeptidase [Amycolatopsis sp.]HET6709873.1 M15 family metallopeptidase [Amycolatopsis sp.]